MPKKGMAPAEEFQPIRVHRRLVDEIKRLGSPTEIINKTLAERYLPKLLKEFEEFANKRKYSFSRKPRSLGKKNKET